MTPVGMLEIAQLLQVKPHTVHTWQQRGLLPPPRWVVSGKPCWDLRDIEKWNADRKAGIDHHR